ncbi:MAG: ribonuclease III [Myxococcota bacterium]
MAKQASAPDPVTARARLCELLGHRFEDPKLLETALTHPSWRNERDPGGVDNQRLEFLGDAVVGLIVTLELVRRLPQRREGELTVLKSQLVRERSLAELAEQVGIGPALLLGKGEDRTGGRERPSVLSDAFESVLGAVLLDAGYAATTTLLLDLMHESLDAVIAQVQEVAGPGTELSASTANWKTALQELLQQLGVAPPTYDLVGELGPTHARRFQVRATTSLQGQERSAEGAGSTKKAAETEAAQRLYAELRLLVDANQTAST